MPPTVLVSRPGEVLRPSSEPSRVDAPPTVVDACACCRLTRDQHGVQLIHRFVPPGQRVASW